LHWLAAAADDDDDDDDASTCNTSPEDLDLQCVKNTFCGLEEW